MVGSSSSSSKKKKSKASSNDPTQSAMTSVDNNVTNNDDDNGGHVPTTTERSSSPVKATSTRSDTSQLFSSALMTERPGDDSEYDFHPPPLLLSPTKKHVKTKKQCQTDSERPIADTNDRSDDPNVTKNETTKRDESSSSSSSSSGTSVSSDRDVLLFQSSRMGGYFVVCLASGINYHAAVKSEQTIGEAVPSKLVQRQYAMAVSMVSIILCACSIIVHLDNFTPLRHVWKKGFRPKAKFERGLLIFLVFWWSIATGIQTSVTGIAGDGKGQFDLYFSTWICCMVCWQMFERYLVGT